MAINTKTEGLVTAGMQFGKWTALEDQRFGFIKKVLCQCECGTKRSTSVHNLETGRSLSCGCVNKEILATSGTKRRKHHLNPGDRFGRLTVVDASHYMRVECICDCGNTHTLTAGALYRNMTRSCGCIKMEQIRTLGKKHQPMRGASLHPMYSTWQRLAQGHRPMHEPWRTDPVRFIAEVEAEIGPRPKDMWFRCRDERLGFVPGNIFWGDHIVHKNQRVVLTADQKREIAELVREGYRQYEVAQAYQVSNSTVSSICKDERYAA